MPQLFLYLTLIIASTVTMGEAQDLSAKNAFEQSASCVEHDLSDDNTDFDSLDDCLFTRVSLVSESAKHTDLSRFTYAPTYTAVGNFSIRAPPALLS